MRQHELDELELENVTGVSVPLWLNMPLHQRLTHTTQIHPNCDNTQNTPFMLCVVYVFLFKKEMLSLVIKLVQVSEVTSCRESHVDHRLSSSNAICG